MVFLILALNVGWELSETAGGQCVCMRFILLKSVSIKYASWKKCLQKFCRRHPSLRVPSNQANTE